MNIHWADKPEQIGRLLPGEVVQYSKVESTTGTEIYKREQIVKYSQSARWINQHRAW